MPTWPSSKMCIRDSYYVTFDSIAVGAQQAQFLVDNAEGTDNPLYLYAGAATDNNAFIFFEGAWQVLQPKIADGTFRIVNSVSYTHLDVYKRQELHGAAAGGVEHLRLWPDAPIGQAALLAGGEAVSYTHLDVYKRQALGRARLMVCSTQP